MRRSELAPTFQAFLALKGQVLSFRGRPNQEVVDQREQLWSLAKQLRSEIDLFGEEEKEQILSVTQQALFPTPLLRSFYRRSRSHSISRSVGGSNASSVGSASFLSADVSASMSNTEEKESLAALMEAKLMMEEEAEEEARKMEEERRKMEEMERAQRKKERERKRALIARAAASGVGVETLGLVEDTAARPLHSSLNTGLLAANTSTSGDDITRLIGSQRVRATAIKEEDKFAGSNEKYPHFRARLKVDVLDVAGATPEEKFNGLVDRVKGEAKGVVDNFVYVDDKGVALKEALEELDFYYGKKKGCGQAMLKKVLEGKEVSATSIEQVKGLAMELQQMVTFARASGDASFLALDETVIAICRVRLSHKLKGEFAGKSEKREIMGLEVDVDFLIKFLKDWYTSLNRTFSMSVLVKEKSSSSSSSSVSSFSSTSSSPNPKQVRAKTPNMAANPAVGVAVNPASTKPASEAAVAAMDSYYPRGAWGGGYQRWSAPRQSWSTGNRRWSAPTQQFASQRQWQSSSPQNWSNSASRGVNSGFQCPTWGAPTTGAVEEACVVCGASHPLVECDQFHQLPVEQRRDCIWTFKRCYRCCGAGHRAAECYVNQPCSICGQSFHHSLLHPNPPGGVDRSSAAPSASSVVETATGQKLLQLSGTTPASTPSTPAVSVSVVDGGSGERRCFRPILPVRVEFENGDSVSTYALLDSGSNKTVMTEALVGGVGCPMEEEVISVRGLGVASSEKRKVGNVTLRSMVDGSFSVETKAIVVDQIPASKDQVARKEDVEGRAHLVDVRLIELKGKGVEMILGTDVSSSFHPLEVRHATTEGPDAWRTPFGWCLLGQDGTHFEPDVWTAAVDAKKVDADVNEGLEQLVRQDFPERAATKLGPSHEDLHAEKVLKDGFGKMDDVPTCAPSEDAPKEVVKGVSNACKKEGESGKVNEFGFECDTAEDDFHVRADRKSGGSPLPDASMVGVGLATQVLEEVSMEVGRKWFQTGSLTAFYHPRNRREKYPVFMANRINEISLSSQAQDWRWVLTDGASTVGAVVLQADRLAAEADPQEARPQEVATDQVFGELIERQSRMDKVYRVVAYDICFTCMVQASRSVGGNATQDTVSLLQVSSPPPSPSPTELVAAEKSVIKDGRRRHFVVILPSFRRHFGDHIRRFRGGGVGGGRVKKVVRHHHFGDHIRRLQGGGQIKRDNRLLKVLNLFVGDGGKLRVGGRLRMAALAWRQRHPLVLPRHDCFAWKQRGSSAEAAWKQRGSSASSAVTSVPSSCRRSYGGDIGLLAAERWWRSLRAVASSATASKRRPRSKIWRTYLPFEWAWRRHSQTSALIGLDRWWRRVGVKEREWVSSSSLACVGGRFSWTLRRQSMEAAMVGGDDGCRKTSRSSVSSLSSVSSGSSVFSPSSVSSVRMPTGSVWNVTSERWCC